MYKYELHTHTQEVSRCGKKSARDIVAIYKNIGYQGLVITDHFRPDYFNSLDKDLTWQQKVDIFLEGYREAKEAAKDIDFDVFLGIELGLFQGGYGNEFLLYGMTEEVLKENETILEMDLVEVKSLAEKHGILIYQAHPYRGYCELEDVNLLDGVEVFNGNPRHDSKNDEVNQIANTKKLLKVSGSDYHEDGDEGCGGIEVQDKIVDNQQLVKILRSMDFKLMTK
ncbi:PHP domain-containing protein [Vallitalea okinawensis]|uniref:PHP domain-containing protein n=1 Tax=Vallitalea okinawensis TaxID=2078660 RepID=UPI000CFAB614|nr:PHP domain-containing protein [Vallitalea okinawensis]